MNMNNNMNYNIFNLENDWDEIPNAGTNNKSIFKESLQSNNNDSEVANWESTIIYYINDVDKGYGYVTLDKMRDDLDYIYDIQLTENDVRDWCKAHQNICHLFTLGGIEVVLTKTAPSFDIIAKDLGLTEGVDYDNTIIEEEIQPDQKYPVKSPISESTQELTEKTWEYKMPVDVVRDLADASDVGDLNGMSDGLIKCYKWISENVSDFYSDIDFEADEEYLSGLKVEYFEDEDELEEEIDGAINAFYDLCDAFNIWVPNYADIAIEEDIDEELEEGLFSKKESPESLLNKISNYCDKNELYFVTDKNDKIIRFSIEDKKLTDMVNKYNNLKNSIEENTNINIDNMNVEIDTLDNEYNKIDDEASCCNYDDSFDYDRDEFKSTLLKEDATTSLPTTVKTNIGDVEVEDWDFSWADDGEVVIFVKDPEVKLTIDSEDITGEDGFLPISYHHFVDNESDITEIYLDARTQDIIIDEIEEIQNNLNMYDDEDEDLDESLTDDQKYPIKSPIVEDVNTKYYGVFKSGGSIGDFNNYANHHGTLIAVYDKEHIEDAHIKAKQRRKMLSRGEKDYYKISYIVKPLTQNDLKNDYVKSLISNNLNESFKNHSNKIEEKWNIGSDKSNLTTEEMNKLKDLAKMLQDNSPNNWKYTVEKTYEDFGAGMQWYTIICHDRSGDSWQVLNTKEWLDLMNSDNIKAIYDVVVNGRYFQDKAQKGKIDLWKWDI